MTNPVYKIETYTGAVLDHTITKDADNIYFKEIITDGIGSFSFTVPIRMGGSYVYNDIALHDKVKIWLGYDAIAGDPNFIGRVGNISGPLSIESGFVRRITGLSQGEILLREALKNVYYTGTNASVIVAAWATTLSLGTGDITADTNQPDIEVRTKSYFDLLREISDYWVDGANQIKKDFYVDVDFDLVWKTRPIRSAGVETLTVGEEIRFCNVTQKVDPVKNNITVYGAQEAALPRDKDLWTDSLDNWTLDDGDSIALNAGNKVWGTNSIYVETGAASDIGTFHYTPSATVTIREVNEVNVWRVMEDACGADGPELRLLAPDDANYFMAYLGAFTGAWTFKTYSLGPNQIYDAADNPNGVWHETGAPNWWDIQAIQFHVDFTFDNRWILVDGLYFYPARWIGIRSDLTSKNTYGVRDHEVTDDKLHSDAECIKRAETLEYMLKDHPTQIEIYVVGNPNVLVGDRLSMTIPAEDISAVNYDVMSVEHALSYKGAGKGYWTRATMVNSANIRQPLITDPVKSLRQIKRQIRTLESG